MTLLLSHRTCTRRSWGRPLYLAAALGHSDVMNVLLELEAVDNTLLDLKRPNKRPLLPVDKTSRSVRSQTTASGTTVTTTGGDRHHRLGNATAT